MKYSYNTIFTENNILYIYLTGLWKDSFSSKKRLTKQTIFQHICRTRNIFNYKKHNLASSLNFFFSYKRTFKKRYNENEINVIC